MSGQVFSARERKVFWDVYHRKCYYCRKDLLLVEVELDHVVPEELLNRSAAAIKKELRAHKVPVTFDIASYENIVVSCGPCNGLKGTLFLPEGLLGITLARAAKNALTVQGKVNARVNAVSVDRALELLSGALDAGYTTGPSVVKYLRKNGYLGFMATSGVHAQVTPQASRTQILFSPRAAQDLAYLQESLDLEDLVSMFNSSRLEVSRVEVEGQEPIISMRSADGEMFYKYQRQRGAILVMSAHLAGY